MTTLTTPTTPTPPTPLPLTKPPTTTPSLSPSPLSDLLEITPPNLHFTLHPHTQSTTTLTLHNKTLRPLFFKIKTTKPKRYCVQPNVAQIPGGDKMIVEVMMREVGEVLPVDVGKCRDKFQVLCCMGGGDGDDVDGDREGEEVWRKGVGVRGQKLRVVLERGDGDGDGDGVGEGVGKREGRLLDGGVVGGVVDRSKGNGDGGVGVGGEMEDEDENENLKKTQGIYYPLKAPIPNVYNPVMSSSPVKESVNGKGVVKVSGAKPPLPSPRSLKSPTSMRESFRSSSLESRDMEQEQDGVNVEEERKKVEKERVEEAIKEEERRRIEEERERVVHPAIAPVPAIVKLSAREKRRVIGEKAELLTRCSKERDARIEELKKRLAEETSRLSDARMAVQGAPDVKYQVDEAAKIPLAQVGLMAAIAVTALAMLV